MKSNIWHFGMDFSFLDLPASKDLFQIFNKYGIDAKFVGGCVRDALIGRHTDDYDVAVNAKIENVMQILEKEGIYCIKTGVKYGSIIAIIKHTKFDITSLRCDLNCNGRGCEVKKSNSFLEDARRRDFTVNAMYVDQYGQLFDYFDGQNDLKNKVIRFIGDPVQRIIEDNLRILRYYRFCCVIGDYSNIYADILEKNAHFINTLPIERVQQELFKIICDKKIINIMYNSGVLQQIFDVDIDVYNALKSNNFVTMFVALFGYQAALYKFRLPNNIKKEIKIFQRFEQENIMYCLYKNKSAITNELILLKNAKYNNQIKKYSDLNVVFPITYYDLPKNIKNASKKLSICEKWWAENNFIKNKNECIEFVLQLQD